MALQNLQSMISRELGIIEKKVFHILSEYFQSSGAFSAQAAAQEIDKLNPIKSPEANQYNITDTLEDFLWMTWNIFIEVARQIPHDDPFQDRLADVVKALALLPPLTAEIWQTNTRLWTDLPLLGPSMRGLGLAAASVTQGDIDNISTANGSLYKGSSMLFLERWGVWKSGLATIGEQTDSKTSQLAMETKERMEAIEQGLDN
ncbi:hypothetical protein ETB97_008478 [Aspergillus alliaceus]|uniref:Uncharacterized protein n=1 Tax=Petromyces alliaceus TaxID=209559 RepID=A0A8H5ZUX9_PETAA|nr:hypothetical protein ETB97_008478 [Aspergillus burnettii]